MGFMYSFCLGRAVRDGRELRDEQWQGPARLDPGTPGPFSGP